MEKIKKIIKEIIPYILIIILVLLIKVFIISPIKVNGSSMEDTLYDGDIMLLNIIGYKVNDIKRFDIVVVNEGNEYIIKRVIGLPGEKIEYKNNKLYVNNKKTKDNYSNKKTEDFSVVVPKNSYYVLGDNRTNSLDSRYFGSFKKSKILGKAKIVFFPFDRVGVKK